MSYGPPPGRSPAYGGAGAGFGGPGAANETPGYGAGPQQTNTNLSYAFPTAGSFVAEPFAPGAPSLGCGPGSGMPRNSSEWQIPPSQGYGAEGPGSYVPPYGGAGGSYGGGGPGGMPGMGSMPGGATPFPPPGQSFLAGLGDFPGGGLGGPGSYGGGLGGAGGASGSGNFGVGPCGGATSSAPGPDTHAREASKLSPSPPGPGAGDLRGIEADSGKPPSEAAAKAAAKPPPRKPPTEPPRKKKAGRLGCC